MKHLIHPHVSALFAAFSLALSACGGGGSSSNDSSAPPLATPIVPAEAFAGTAYLKTTNTVLYNGKTEGLARRAFQAQVDQCNGLRALYYGLPAVSPSEPTLASLDVSVHEKYFDTNKALTLITGTGLELTDVQRWLNEAAVTAAAGTYPAVAMDCAAVRVAESKSGTLWRDGMKYELRFDTRKALGSKSADTRLALAPASEFLAFPADIFLGQSCREVSAPAGALANGKSCIWDAFPYVSYLNWPFALSGQVQFGASTTLVEAIVPVAAERGQAIAASVFEIPAGFTTTLSDGGTP